MSKKIHLAVDLGASSGRVLAGQFDGQSLELSEVHRFWNGPIRVHDGLHWDILGLWKSVQEGLAKANDEFGSDISSLGVDTWGVDFALLGPGDELLGQPRHYRDPRTAGLVEAAFDIMPRAEIFAATGLQFMEINSLYQLFALQQRNPQLLHFAEDFLMIPDLFHWFLTGVKTNEFTDATTTQLLNPKTGKWATDVLSAFQIPEKLFRDPTHPGEDLGTLRSHVESTTGLQNVNVIVPGSHDTASAVLAVPAESEVSNKPDWCYISSGTWSLMGVEVPAPIINDKCLELNFTNEGGVGGTVRVLKNICGLWLLQECRRIFIKQGRDYGWDEITKMATDAVPLEFLVHPDAPDFVAPESMPDAIRNFCKKTGQAVPQNDGAVLRCALESLAMRYRQVLGWLEELTGAKIRTIHIVGGGTQNEQLNQMAADACRCRVVAGPVEATAIGNTMMQMIATGGIESVRQARQVVANSFQVQTYKPQNADLWDEKYAKFVELTIS